MKDKTFTILSVLSLIVIVGIMSWHDMHPSVRSVDLKNPVLYTYLAGENITPAMIPDDAFPVTVDLGAFSYTPAGQMAWAGRAMDPITLVQRQTNLLFHFEGLPQAPDETLQKAAALIKSWEQKGSDPSVIFLDYRPKAPDLKAYVAFLKTFHARFSRSYSLATVIDASWLDDPQNPVFGEIESYAPNFLIALEDARIEPALLSKLEKFRHNFILCFPAGTFPADVDAAAFKNLVFLTNYSFTLDARKPWPKKTEKIGILPQF